jgi:hypothetical protein
MTIQLTFPLDTVRELAEHAEPPPRRTTSTHRLR